MRRLILVLASLLMGCIGIVHTGSVNAAPATVHVHVYDGNHQVIAVTGAVSERGPPAAHDRNTIYDTVDRLSTAVSARLDRSASRAVTTYAPAAQVACPTTTTREQARRPGRGLSSFARSRVAAKTGGKIPWTSWQNYPKVPQGGRDYAQIGDRLYTRHAVDRMQPSGLGAPAGASGPGQSISPNYIEDVLGSSKGIPVKGPNGEPRMSSTSGTVQVITEDNTVITVITR